MDKLHRVDPGRSENQEVIHLLHRAVEALERLADAAEGAMNMAEDAIGALYMISTASLVVATNTLEAGPSDERDLVNKLWQEHKEAEARAKEQAKAEGEIEEGDA